MSQVLCAFRQRRAVCGLLAVRIADQQQVIANLVTVDSEQRLGKTLLQLARKLGKKDPRSIRIEPEITHEELSEMVGATRPRIGLFMQRFYNLGLIETNADHFLIIKEKKLVAYLAQIAWRGGIRPSLIYTTLALCFVPA